MIVSQILFLFKLLFEGGLSLKWDYVTLESLQILSVRDKMIVILMIFRNDHFYRCSGGRSALHICFHY